METDCKSSGSRSLRVRYFYVEQYENDHVYALIARARAGDMDAKAQLVTENMGLVHSISVRFQGRGADMEDLHQIGAMGLLLAIDRFDTSAGTRFSTYAVPLILGEIRRFLRDDGMIKVSRSLKTLAYRASALSEKMCAEQGRNPTVHELARALQVSKEELVQAMESAAPVGSFSTPIGETGKTLSELLPAPESDVSILDRMDIHTAISALPPREQTLVQMRYMGEKSQSEVAKRLGISQVQVSRLERKILERLRNALIFDEIKVNLRERY